MHIIFTGVNFLDLDGLIKVEFDLSFSDGSSHPIYFSDGIPIGRDIQTTAFVSHT